MPDQRFLWLYPDGDLDQPGERWIREGRCSGCGACCQLEEKMRYTIGHDGEGEQKSQEQIEAMDNRGWPRGTAIAGEDWDGSWVWWQKIAAVDASPICSAYDGQGRCTRHDDADRSEICRKWPVMPTDLADYASCCSFTFRRAEA